MKDFMEGITQGCTVSSTLLLLIIVAQLIKIITLLQ